jgi:hypothetical protein
MMYLQPAAAGGYSSVRDRSPFNYLRYFAKERHMPSLGTTTFKGGSGHQYRFRVFPLGTRFRKISGIFIIANRQRDANGQYRHAIVHVGHTADFSQPLLAGDKTNDLVQEGANCVCVQSDGSEASRLEKERDLIARFARKRGGQAADFDAKG